MRCHPLFHPKAGYSVYPRVLGQIFLLTACAALLTACGHSMEKGRLSGDTDVPLLLKAYDGPLNHLSAVRRGECPMAPSCSEFCKQAVQKHGIVAGWIMAVDRLLRCGRDELDIAPRVRIGGTWKAADPVENNDFWW